MDDWQVYPKVTVQVSEADAAALFGLDGGLEGWKIFKKIGRAFKKVGKVIKKVATSKVFKVALPIAGAFFAPLALAKAGSVAKVLGGRIGRLVGGGKTKGIIVKTVTGARKVGLVSPAEYERFRGILKNPSQAISESMFRDTVGEDVAEREAEGAVVKGSQIELPTYNQPTMASASTIPATSALGKAAPMLALGAVGVMLAMMLGRGRR